MAKINNEVLKEIRTHKFEVELQSELNLMEALQNSSIKKYYSTCKSLIFQIAKNKYENKLTKDLQDDLLRTKKLLAQTLKKNNIKPESLKPNYDCKICKDKGVIDNQYCNCFKEKLSKKLLSNCGISIKSLPSFDNMDLSIFKKEEHKKAVLTMSKFLQDFVTKLDVSDKKIVTISGNVGVGKTYLCQCVVNDAIKKGQYVTYTSAFNLNQDFLKYHLAKLEDKSDIINKYLECDLLCIDDLGTENILKNVTVEYLYLILNERLSKEKATIITTNLDLQQIIDTYDERIFSRIANKNACYLFNLQGDDLRLSKKI